MLENLGLVFKREDGSTANLDARPVESEVSTS